MKRPRRTTNRPTGDSPQGAESSTTLRIIGGTHRGRLLKYTGEARTRPMKDRVREAVFNLVGTEVKGKHAVDLFAGTGALGFESVSRGAERATFFERHFPTADLIVENAKSIGLDERCQVIPANTLVQFRKSEPFDGPVPQIPWVVFCSPPYDLYIDQAADMLRLLESVIAASPPSSVIVVETDERFDFEQLSHYGEWDRRTYPPAEIAILRKESTSR